MHLLALETSTRTPTAALFRNGLHVQATEVSLEQPPGSASFPAQILDLLGTQRITPADLDAIAVSSGPGSFTGLRLGIVLAKTWAWATGCPLIAVDTFESLATAAISQKPISVDSSIHIVADAHRNQLFLGTFQQGEDGVVAKHQTRIIGITALDGIFKPGDWLVGPALSKTKVVEQIQRAPMIHALPINPEAKLVGVVAWQMFQAKMFSDPFELEPKYIRPSAAEEKLNDATRH